MQKRMIGLGVLVLVMMALAVATYAQGKTVYPATDPLLVYDQGNWRSVNVAAAEHGTLMYATDSGARLSMSFTGNGTEVLYSKGPDGGQFQIQVWNADYSQQLYYETIPTLNSTYTYGNRYLLPNVSSGTYTFIIVNDTGTIWIEGLEIQGQLIPFISGEPYGVDPGLMTGEGTTTSGTSSTTSSTGGSTSSSTTGGSASSSGLPEGDVSVPDQSGDQTADPQSSEFSTLAFAALATYDCNAASGIALTDCEALVAFYNAMGGDTWINKTDWAVSATPCTWFGVTCTNQRVTAISLIGNNLTGILPDEISQLANLVTLDLDNNEITGELPVSWATLANLKVLRLNKNRLSGVLPPEWGNFPVIDSLQVGRNALRGLVPANWLNLADTIDTSTIDDDPNGFSIIYNMLDAKDPAVVAMLNEKHRTWLNNQTVPPNSFATNAMTQNQVTLFWDPVFYIMIGSGSYEVSYKALADTTYTVLPLIPSAAQQLVTGLTPSTTYEFRIRSYTPAIPPTNKNELYSDYYSITDTTLAAGTPTANADSYAANAGVQLNVPAASGVLANDTDPENDPLTATLVTPPSEGTFQLNTDGSFAYTPPSGLATNIVFTYTARDNASNVSLPATVTIAVTLPNFAPTATPDASNPLYVTDFETPLIIPAATGVLANDTDANGDPLTAVLVSNVDPTKGTLLFNSDGSFTFTPATGVSGDVNFSYRANDGKVNSNNAALVRITVRPQNLAPVASNDTFTDVQMNTAYVVAAPGVLANDTDINLDPISAVLVANPLHGTVVFNANGGFTYTPAANYFGDDTFTYRASDSKLTSNVATVALTVQMGNFPPVPVNDTYSMEANRILTVASSNGVLKNDTDPNPGNVLSVTVVSTPLKGTLTLNQDGSFTYRPQQNFVGEDSFTYRINDGAVNSTGVGSVRLIISAPNVLPTPNNDTYTIAAGNTLTIDAANGVLKNDTDLNADPLSAVLTTSTANGLLQLNANGSFSYTPKSGFVGQDVFSYRASDGKANSAVIATVSINVIGSAAAGTATATPTPTGSLTATATEEPLPVVTATVLANGLNLRAQPSLRALRIDSLSQGETFTVIGRSGDGQWAQLDTGDEIGWASVLFLEFTGEFMKLPITDGTADSGEEGTFNLNLQARIIATIGLNFRIAPAFQAARIRVLPFGQVYKLVAYNSSRTWAQLEVEGRLGWVFTRWIEVDGQGGGGVPGAIGVVYPVGNMRVRMGPGFGFGQIGAVGWGDMVALLGQSADGRWIKIVFDNGRVGWSLKSWYRDSVTDRVLSLELPEVR